VETGADGVGSTHTHDGVHGPKEKKDKEGSRLDAAKKWIGLGAAILSLGTAVYARIEYVAEQHEHARIVAEHIATSRTQQAAQDYAQAWASLQSAVKGTKGDGLLVRWLGGSGVQREQLITAEQDLAMEWLRVAPSKLADGQHYADITDQVLPVLSGGLEQASGSRKADLLAHIGWAYALKQDDGVNGLHPEQFYKDALALDLTNPYANTFLGDPIVGSSSGSEAGMAQFKQRFFAALASPRSQGAVRRWIREQELGSMHTWLGYPAVEAVFWQTVDQMHKAGEPIGETALQDMRDEYIGTSIGVEPFTANLTKVQAFVPLADHIEMLRLLVPKLEAGESRGFVDVSLAIALEKAGKADQALAAWRDAKAALAGNDLAKDADSAIARLTAGRVKHH
jgi:hypothetical protein